MDRLRGVMVVVSVVLVMVVVVVVVRLAKTGGETCGVTGGTGQDF